VNQRTDPNRTSNTRKRAQDKSAIKPRVVTYRQQRDLVLRLSFLFLQSLVVLFGQIQQFLNRKREPAQVTVSTEQQAGKLTYQNGLFVLLCVLLCVLDVQAVCPPARSIRT